MNVLVMNSVQGYAMVTGIVVLAVAIFTMIQLRKQVKKRKEEEGRKTKTDL